MTKNLLLIFVLIALYGCSSPHESKTNSPVPDSATAGVTKVQAVGLSVDSSVYVGRMFVFKETSEFYTHLNSLEGNLPWGELAKKLDSTIYHVDEVNRRRLPLEVAQQYFSLAGLGRIGVYDQKGNLVTEALFQRVELFEDVIEGQYVAVFKPVSFSEDVSYCVSSSLSPGLKTSRVSTQELKDDELAGRLYDRFEIDSMDVQWVNHQTLSPGGAVYSVIATNPKSLLIETVNNDSHILFQTDSTYSVMEVQPLSIEVNGKPLLLASMGVIDTDMIWTSLLAYDSTAYKVVEGERIVR